MEVHLAARLARGQTHHGHHRHAPVDDDADIGHALIRDPFENRVEMHAILEQGGIGLSAQAVKAAQDIGNVMLDRGLAEQPAVASR